MRNDSVKSEINMGWLILIVALLLQWNASSLLANSQEFKYFIEQMFVKPDVICVQETWLRPTLDYVLYSGKEG